MRRKSKARAAIERSSRSLSPFAGSRRRSKTTMGFLKFSSNNNNSSSSNNNNANKRAVVATGSTSSTTTSNKRQTKSSSGALLLSSSSSPSPSPSVAPTEISDDSSSGTSLVSSNASSTPLPPNPSSERRGGGGGGVRAGGLLFSRNKNKNRLEQFGKTRLTTNANTNTTTTNRGETVPSNPTPNIVEKAPPPPQQQQQQQEEEQQQSEQGSKKDKSKKSNESTAKQQQQQQQRLAISLDDSSTLSGGWKEEDEEDNESFQSHRIGISRCNYLSSKDDENALTSLVVSGPLHGYIAGAAPPPTKQLKQDQDQQQEKEEKENQHQQRPQEKEQKDQQPQEKEQKDQQLEEQLLQDQQQEKEQKDQRSQEPQQDQKQDQQQQDNKMDTSLSDVGSTARDTDSVVFVSDGSVNRMLHRHTASATTTMTAAATSALFADSNSVSLDFIATEPKYSMHQSAPLLHHHSFTSISTTTTTTTTRGENSTLKVFVLLLQPATRTFELIQIRFDPNLATIGSLLASIPLQASEPLLGNQPHCGFCRPGDRANQFLDLEQLASNPISPPHHRHNDLDADSSHNNTAEIRHGEILVAIPRGYTSTDCNKIASQLLTNPRLLRALNQSDPLRPRPSVKSSSNSTHRRKRRASSTKLVAKLQQQLNGISRRDDSSFSSSMGLSDILDQMSIGTMQQHRRSSHIPPTVLENAKEVEVASLVSDPHATLEGDDDHQGVLSRRQLEYLRKTVSDSAAKAAERVFARKMKELVLRMEQVNKQNSMTTNNQDVKKNLKDNIHDSDVDSQPHEMELLEAW